MALTKVFFRRTTDITILIKEKKTTILIWGD